MSSRTGGSAHRGHKHTVVCLRLDTENDRLSFDDSDLEGMDRFDELSAIQDEFYPGLDSRK
ncbi:hypothetical protein DPMN_077892 [Dreissena polymorpha]|uniref:Uncharacterized protein n=1 Tax=Dreissena polymorpha TaxID=45954 RepID=A0A9D3YQU4_DREPO|nr:hypothetical protein DPMN_077892 [Dreissena polymorpha]